MTVRPAALVSALLLPFVLSCAGPLTTSLGAQQTAGSPLPTTALAGQKIALLPITLIASDPAFQGDSGFAPYADRRAGLLHADSAIGEAFSGRAPEVTWVLPGELRKVARRAPGIVGDPDQMGQAVMRSPKLKDVPDPFRANLRSLVALTGGRLALVPAALGFGRADSTGIRADLSFALADARSGKVLWRTVASGRGATPDRALAAALAVVLPLDVIQSPSTAPPPAARP